MHLYQQIISQLYQEILSGVYKEGSLLPTESEIMKRYKASRTTVRNALANLVEEGFIYRRPGKGSFVKKGIFKKKTQMILHGSFSDILSVAKETTATVQNFEYVLPSPEIENQLSLKKDKRVLRVERVRFFDKTPFMFSINYLPQNVGRYLSLLDLEEHTLAELLFSKCKKRLKTAHQVFSSTVADHRLSKLLEIPIGFPLLSIRRITFSDEDEPINFFLGFFRSDIYVFSAEFSYDNKI